MEIREVVTVFLHHEGRILLLKRSDRVGTYPRKWAGVSGYLEAEPAEQARRELAEEVSLGPEDVGSLKSGSAVEVIDEEHTRLWRVHPFLAEVKEPGRIRLDWENVEMRWILPEEVGGFDTVPGLDEALRRVWP